MEHIPLLARNRPDRRGTPLPLHEGDPYELVGMVLPGAAGQSEAMARALVEEFILLGWKKKQLLTLFGTSCYLGTYRIGQEKGQAWVQALIDEIWAHWHQAGGQKADTGIDHG